MMLALMILSASLSAAPARADRVEFCFLFCSVSRDPPADSFCQVYERVYLQAGDSDPIKAARPAVRRAIDKNEAKYLCICKKWDNPICAEVAHEKAAGK